MKNALLLLLLPGAVAAQAADRDPAFTAVGAFFAVSVADLEASADWYVEKLGLTVTRRHPPYQGTSVLILEGGGVLVELVHTPAAVPLATAAPAVAGPTHVHGIFKVGIVVEDIDATLRALRERGVEIAMGPFPKRADQPANFIILDNGGNYLQFLGR